MRAPGQQRPEQGTFTLLCENPPAESGGGGQRLAWLTIQEYRDNISEVVTRARWNGGTAWQRDSGHDRIIGLNDSGFCNYLRHAAMAADVRRTPPLARTSDRIFAFFGADLLFGYTALAAHRRWRKPLHAYFVDEPVEWCRLQGFSVFRRFLAQRVYRRVLKAAAQVWVISEGYQELLSRTLNVESHVLPPPLPLEPTPSLVPNAPSFDVCHIGSVNFLYESALRRYQALAASVAAATGCRLRLVVCTAQSDRDVRQRLDVTAADPSVLVVNGLDSAGITARCRDALAVILPYSFNESERVMVSTSFPTKTTEAVASGRPIIAFGPRYGSVSATFASRSIPHVCSTDQELTDVLEQLVKAPNATVTCSVRAYSRLAAEFKRSRDLAFGPTDHATTFRQ